LRAPHHHAEKIFLNKQNGKLKNANFLIEKTLQPFVYLIVHLQISKKAPIMQSYSIVTKEDLIDMLELNLKTLKELDVIFCNILICRPIIFAETCCDN
jgi:hypothetical protein